MFKSYIFSKIFLIFNILCISKIQAQDWPCRDAATYNYTIPNANANLNLSENSVAVDPRHPNIVLSANNINNPPQVSVFVSTNWGINWYSQTENGVIDAASFCDPGAAINLDGHLFVSYLAGSYMRVAKSTDVGLHWSSVTIPGSLSADQGYICIDNYCNSPYEGRLYCAWNGLGGPGPIYYSISDNGIDWSNPVSIPYSGFGVNIKTDNLGTVYMIWEVNNLTNFDRIQFIKSTNGGANWSSPTTTIPLIYNGSINGGGALPTLAVNMQNNSLYIVYSAFIPYPQNDYDVLMFKSVDGGLNWSDAITVNQVLSGHQTFPWLSCDPMTGYLACIYYDTRAGGGKHTYVSISTNSGLNWCDMKVSTEAIGVTGTGADYIGLDFNKGVIYPVWTTGSLSNFRTLTYPFYVIQRDLIVYDQNYSGINLIQSANTITAYNINLFSGSNVTYRTVNSITLLPGFITDENSNFKAELFTCQSGSDNSEDIIQVNENSLSSKEKLTLPFVYSLSQNYPNPFNPSTLIKYSLKENSFVKIIIYNILGQEVIRLVDKYEYAGYKSVVWNGTNDYGTQVSSGIYFYKLVVSGAKQTQQIFTDEKKMVLIR